MNWEDEPYIKLYTRDTVSYKLLPWQGRCLLPLIMRKLDRAGVMDIGKYPPSEAISVMVDVPIDVTKVGIEALLQSGIFEHIGDSIICPNFLEAQEARQSDKARQALSRQRRKDKANWNNVTKCDSKSQNVTNSHTVSHGVTNRIEKNRIDHSSVVKLSQDCKGSEDDSAAPHHTTEPEVSLKAPDWHVTPVTWQSVYMCIQELAAFTGDASYHKKHLASIAHQCNQQHNPAATLERVVKCKMKEVEKNGRRIEPKWIATDFDRLLNTQTNPEQDDTYKALQRRYWSAEDDLKLQKSIGTKKSIARAEQQYNEAMKEYNEYRRTHTN
jgi:hypothetical protein